MRRLPQPGQSIPNNALVGHTGSGPFGVVGSPAQMAAHINVVDAATTSGAPRPACAAPRRVTNIEIRAQNIAASAAFVFVFVFSAPTDIKMT